MLYLAQVCHVETLDKINIRLFAVETTQETWAILPNQNHILTCDNSAGLTEGLLVLVEISSSGQIVRIQEANNWVLELIQTYLTKGITPDFLQEEFEKIEQWRQTLTLQSQELSRRMIEVETRREQIQNLEETLKREKRLLRMVAEKLRQQPR
jgi:small-conductance mechanosensitive channel